MSTTGSYYIIQDRGFLYSLATVYSVNKKLYYIIYDNIICNDYKFILHYIWQRLSILYSYHTLC